MEIDGYKCVMCGRHISHCRTMQVHHITYARLGNENVLTDLCTLCGSCHKKIHNYYNRKRSNKTKGEQHEQESTADSERV
ncbi:MAG: HNH endonuclease [Solobacterium sp.]|nr:HNH endonuclease [Solobacterium sp.]